MICKSNLSESCPFTFSKESFSILEHIVNPKTTFFRNLHSFKEVASFSSPDSDRFEFELNDISKFVNLGLLDMYWEINSRDESVRFSIPEKSILRSVNSSELPIPSTRSYTVLSFKEYKNDRSRHRVLRVLTFERALKKLPQESGLSLKHPAILTFRISISDSRRYSANASNPAFVNY